MSGYYIILTPFFPTLDDFVGPYIYDQVKALQKAGEYDVIVIKLIRNKSAATYNYQGLKVHEFEVSDLPSYICPGLFQKKNLKKLLSLLLHLTNDQLQAVKFIHGHVTYPSGLLAVELAQQIGASSIVQHHGFDVMGYTNGCFQQKWLQKLNARWINKLHVPVLNLATWNVGVSHKTISALHEIPGYQQGSELVLYNGVDQSKFHPLEGLKDKEFFTIGCVANFWPIKDQMTLIKAVQNLRALNPDYNNIQVKLIGTGILLEACKQYVLQHELTSAIQFLPTLDHTALNEFYNRLDLFVLPSYYEAFGCVYTEAYACGVPFIAVEGQGIAELITFANVQYQLIKPGDVKALSRKIEYFYHHRSFKPALNENVEINFLINEFLMKITE